MAERGQWPDELVPRESGLYSHHSQVQCEQASREICIVMNCLSYGPEIRQARSDAYREADRLHTSQSRGLLTMITTGSKAEGLTRYTESDRDTMCVKAGIMCIEEGVPFDILPREITVFTLSTIMCYHGHCRLLLERAGIMTKLISDALCDNENGRTLLCSDLYGNLWSPDSLPDYLRDKVLKTLTGLVLHDRAGPSKPSSIEEFHEDVVNAIFCHCPSILQKWAARRRHWPSTAIIQKVESLGAYVVPVGFKGSEYMHIEWRVCFNTGENELLKNLNNTLVYVYVMLKMVIKDVIRPVKKEITPYTVKNIVWWIAENNPQQEFNERSLFYWLHEGLGELRTAIATERLPYYMIPERNLMAACGLSGEQKQTWVATITEMMTEGPKLILRLPTIRKAVISHPEPIMWYSKKRVEHELLFLKDMNRATECEDENGVVNESDPMLQVILGRLVEILIEVRQRMNGEGSRLKSLGEITDMMLM